MEEKIEVEVFDLGKALSKKFEELFSSKKN